MHSLFADFGQNVMAIGADPTVFNIFVGKMTVVGVAVAAERPEAAAVSQKRLVSGATWTNKLAPTAERRRPVGASLSDFFSPRRLCGSNRRGAMLSTAGMTDI